jgi:hypothetical protein
VYPVRPVLEVLYDGRQFTGKEPDEPGGHLGKPSSVRMCPAMDQPTISRE